MAYVDISIYSVPTAKREGYIEYAEVMAEVFKDSGALQVVECWGDDVPDGKLTSLPKAVLKEEDETVVFAWIIWPSKEARQQGMAQAMQDERMNREESFVDLGRMIFGGFEKILAL